MRLLKQARAASSLRVGFSFASFESATAPRQLHIQKAQAKLEEALLNVSQLHSAWMPPPRAASGSTQAPSESLQESPQLTTTAHHGCKSSKHASARPNDLSARAAGLAANQEICPQQSQRNAHRAPLAAHPTRAQSAGPPHLMQDPVLTQQRWLPTKKCTQDATQGQGLHNSPTRVTCIEPISCASSDKTPVLSKQESVVCGP